MADPEVDLFAGMKKKKKKVVVQEDGGADTTPGAAPTPTTEVQRPKGQNAFGNDEVEEAAEPVKQDGGAGEDVKDGGADEADMFADMKKKKKKSKKEIPADLVSYLF